MNRHRFGSRAQEPAPTAVAELERILTVRWNKQKQYIQTSCVYLYLYGCIHVYPAVFPRITFDFLLTFEKRCFFSSHCSSRQIADYVTACSVCVFFLFFFNPRSITQYSVPLQYWLPLNYWHKFLPISVAKLWNMSPLWKLNAVCVLHWHAWSESRRSTSHVRGIKIL